MASVNIIFWWDLYDEFNYILLGGCFRLITKCGLSWFCTGVDVWRFTECEPHQRTAHREHLPCQLPTERASNGADHFMKTYHWFSEGVTRLQPLGFSDKSQLGVDCWNLMGYFVEMKMTMSSALIGEPCAGFLVGCGDTCLHLFEGLKSVVITCQFNVSSLLGPTKSSKTSYSSKAHRTISREGFMRWREKWTKHNKIESQSLSTAGILSGGTLHTCVWNLMTSFWINKHLSKKSTTCQYM